MALGDDMQLYQKLTPSRAADAVKQLNDQNLDPADLRCRKGHSASLRITSSGSIVGYCDECEVPVPIGAPIVLRKPIRPAP
jgi:hypothetical protein